MPDQVSSVDSLIGLEFSHYRIIEEIGRGGMGVVYRARDAHLDREVAIKVLHPGIITDQGARKHLHKEALALSKLNHLNIATIHDFDTQRGMDFLVMEYIHGARVELCAKTDVPGSSGRMPTGCSPNFGGPGRARQLWERLRNCG